MRRSLPWLAPVALGLAVVVSICLLVRAAPVTWSYTTSENIWGTPQTSVTHEDAGARVVAVYQGDSTAGWDSPQQYQEWWPSACSVFAMYAVLKAFGARTRPGLVLDDEIKEGAITRAHGLVSLSGYANLVPRYYEGLDSTYNAHMQTSHIRQIVAVGLPVLVNIWDPQARYYHFEPGHWLVVVGYTDHAPLADHPPAYAVRDSSGYHLSWIRADAFEYLFGNTHRAVVVYRLGEVVP